MKWSKRQPAAAALIATIPALVLRGAELGFLVGFTILGMHLPPSYRMKGIAGTTLACLFTVLAASMVFSADVEIRAYVAVLLSVFVGLVTLLVQSVNEFDRTRGTMHRRIVIWCSGVAVFCVLTNFLLSRFVAVVNENQSLSMAVGYTIGTVGRVVQPLMFALLGASFGILVSQAVTKFLHTTSSNADVIRFTAMIGLIVAAICGDLILNVMLVNQVSGSGVIGILQFRLAASFFPAAVVLEGLCREMFCLVGAILGGFIGIRLAGGRVIEIRRRTLKISTVLVGSFSAILPLLLVLLFPNSEGLSMTLLAANPSLVLGGVLASAGIGAAIGLCAGVVIEVGISLFGPSNYDRGRSALPLK